MMQLKCYMKDQGAELPKKRWTLLQFNIKLFRVGRLASGITGTGPVGDIGLSPACCKHRAAIRVSSNMAIGLVMSGVHLT